MVAKCWREGKAVSRVDFEIFGLKTPYDPTACRYVYSLRNDTPILFLPPDDVVSHRFLSISWASCFIELPLKTVTSDIEIVSFTELKALFGPDGGMRSTECHFIFLMILCFIKCSVIIIIIIIISIYFSSWHTQLKLQWVTVITVCHWNDVK